MKSLGFIGLGAIGTPMAKRLLSAGFYLSVFDVLPERAEAVEELGARVAASSREVGEGADAVVIVVMNAEQAQEVLFGEGGVARNLPAGAVIIVMCTVGPNRMREIADRVEKLGLRVVDAPVTGGADRAAVGDLVALVGSNKETLEDVNDILKTMASNIVHCGEAPGDGQSVKMVNQLLTGIHLAAAGEALAFAEVLGLDRRLVFDAIKQGAANSFMLENRGESMLAGDFTGGSKLEILVKDTNLVAETAEEAGFRAPLALSARKLYQRAFELGFSKEEDAGVIRVFEENAVSGDHREP